MRIRPALLSLASLLPAACSAPGGPFPTLQPRAAEAIDPRLPVIRPINPAPVDAALAASLARSVGQAHTGEASFAPLMTVAERLAGAAGPRQSEGWIAAEEALSAALAARGPTATALADIDALGGDRLQKQGGMSPADAAAVRSAAAEVGRIDRRQLERIDAVRQRLGG